MPAFTKANVILNDDLLQRDMELLGYSLADVLSVMNEPSYYDVKYSVANKYFRRKWGQQKIRVFYSIRKSIQGEEFALVNQVVADIPPEVSKGNHRELPVEYP